MRSAAAKKTIGDVAKLVVTPSPVKVLRESSLETVMFPVLNPVYQAPRSMNLFSRLRLLESRTAIPSITRRYETSGNGGGGPPLLAVTSGAAIAHRPFHREAAVLGRRLVPVSPYPPFRCRSNSFFLLRVLCFIDDSVNDLLAPLLALGRIGRQRRVLRLLARALDHVLVNRRLGEVRDAFPVGRVHDRGKKRHRVLAAHLTIDVALLGHELNALVLRIERCALHHEARRIADRNLQPHGLGAHLVLARLRRRDRQHIEPFIVLLRLAPHVALGQELLAQERPLALNGIEHAFYLALVRIKRRNALPDDLRHE